MVVNFVRTMGIILHFTCLTVDSNEIKTSRFVKKIIIIMELLY